MSFNRGDCEYIKFNIENSNVEFAADEYGVLISIPFVDDTPQCIKDRLNDIIYEEMNTYQQTVECMPAPYCLRLNARMQIQYSYNDNPQYYISVVITDIPEIDAGTWIDRDMNIVSETIEFQNEFILYCRYKVNQILFPFCTDNQKEESYGDGCT